MLPESGYALSLVLITNNTYPYSDISFLQWNSVCCDFHTVACLTEALNRQASSKEKYINPDLQQRLNLDRDMPGLLLPALTRLLSGSFLWAAFLQQPQIWAFISQMSSFCWSTQLKTERCQPLNQSVEQPEIWEDHQQIKITNPFHLCAFF